MAPPVRSVSEGALYAFLSFYNPTTGDPTGATTTAPPNGSVSNWDTLFGLKVAAPITPDPEIVQATAESLIAEFELDSLTTRSFTAQVAGLDMDQVAQIENVSIATQGSMRGIPEDIDGGIEIDAMLIINSKAKRQDVGAARGRGAWTSVLIPVASVKWLGRDTYTARQVAVYNIRFTPQIVDQALGLTILNEFSSQPSRRILYEQDYPLTGAIARGDGSTVLFPVRSRPVDTAHCFVVEVPAGYQTGGIKKTISAVSTTLPYSISVTGAPALASKLFICFESDQIIDA